MHLDAIVAEMATAHALGHDVARVHSGDPSIYGAIAEQMRRLDRDLLRDAFTPENAEELLDRGAQRYVNHPRGVSVRGDSLTVSSIYVWFRKDFGDTDAGVIAHLKRYATPELAARLAGITRIADHRYDWSINDVR